VLVAAVLMALVAGPARAAGPLESQVSATVVTAQRLAVAAVPRPVAPTVDTAARTRPALSEAADIESVSVRPEPSVHGVVARVGPAVTGATRPLRRSLDRAAGMALPVLDRATRPVGRTVAPAVAGVTPVVDAVARPAGPASGAPRPRVAPVVPSAPRSVAQIPDPTGPHGAVAPSIARLAEGVTARLRPAAVGAAPLVSPLRTVPSTTAAGPVHIRHGHVRGARAPEPEAPGPPPGSLVPLAPAGASSASLLLLLFAALADLLSPAPPGLGRRVSLAPARWRPVLFVSLLERPG
jgi:hypothetical protein